MILDQQGNAEIVGFQPPFWLSTRYHLHRYFFPEETCVLKVLLKSNLFVFWVEQIASNNRHFSKRFPGGKYPGFKSFIYLDKFHFGWLVYSEALLCLLTAASTALLWEFVAWSGPIELFPHLFLELVLPSNMDYGAAEVHWAEWSIFSICFCLHSKTEKKLRNG